MKGTKIKTKLKKDDTVIVISGKEKGKQGKIIEILRESNRVLVEGVNIVKKTIKKTQENPNGGITTKEAPIAISNVMYFDSESGKRTRIGFKIENNKKLRFAKASGANIGKAVN